jgi:hypothetical protein
MQRVEAARSGKVQVEQNEVEIGILLRQRERIVAIRGFEHVEVRVELLQHDAERLPNEWMVIDDEYFQALLPGAATAWLNDRLPLPAAAIER